MYYECILEDKIRVPPNMFDKEVEDAVTNRIRAKYVGYVSEDVGIVIDVFEILNIGEGIVIPGDGAVYYEVKFGVLTFIPENQEVCYARIRDIAEFGAFMEMGALEGLTHIGQAMDDFVSYSKERTLSGKQSNKVLKVGDICKARIVSISFRDKDHPKIGLTMRQPLLGKLEWIEAEQKTPAKE